MSLLDVDVIIWFGEKNWKFGKIKVVYFNFRFCVLISNCLIMDKDWENFKGVFISVILFGGRRLRGVFLVYEVFNW